MNAPLGWQVPVFYRPPAAMGMAGALGFEPQTLRGMVAMMVISWGIVAVVLLLLVVSLPV